MRVSVFGAAALSLLLLAARQVGAGAIAAGATPADRSTSHEVTRIARSAGFEPVAPPLREGTTYVLRAMDVSRHPSCASMVDARSGAIRAVNGRRRPRSLWPADRHGRPLRIPRWLRSTEWRQATRSSTAPMPPFVAPHAPSIRCSRRRVPRPRPHALAATTGRRGGRPRRQDREPISAAECIRRERRAGCSEQTATRSVERPELLREAAPPRVAWRAAKGAPGTHGEDARAAGAKQKAPRKTGALHSSDCQIVGGRLGRLFVLDGRLAVADRDLARLLRLGNLAHEVDVQEAVLELRALDLDVVGKLEARSNARAAMP